MAIAIFIATAVGAIIGFLFGYNVKQDASYHEGYRKGDSAGYMRAVADRANAILRKQAEEDV